MANLNAPFPISLNWVRSHVDVRLWFLSQMWGSSFQHFSYQQATGAVLEIEEHFPNLFSNLNYKVCDLNLGKTVPKKSARDLWSWLWFWLTYDYQNTSYLTAKEKKKQNKTKRLWTFLWHIQYSDFWRSNFFEMVTWICGRHQWSKK